MYLLEFPNKHTRADLAKTHRWFVVDGGSDDELVAILRWIERLSRSDLRRPGTLRNNSTPSTYTTDYFRDIIAMC